MYTALVRKPNPEGATSVAMMTMVARENNGAINAVRGFWLLELETHLYSSTGQIIEKSEPLLVRRHAVLEE